MNPMVVIELKEYEELKKTEEVLKERMKELESLVEDKEALQEYVMNWIY